MNIETLPVLSLVSAGELASNRWKTCPHNRKCKEYIKNRFISSANEYYCKECGITLDQPEDRQNRPQPPRKLARNERWCPVCGRIFRPPKNKRQMKYCSPECAKIAKNHHDKHYMSLGTNTHSLSDKQRKWLVLNLKYNRDFNPALYSADADSAYDIELEDTVYYPGNGEASYTSIGTVRDERD